MLINAVIMVLREVIEASLIVSLFLAFCQISGWLKRAVLLALVIGLLLAVVYAVNIRSISLWLEGAGQEVINAGICLAIYLFLFVFVVTALLGAIARYKRLLLTAMITAITLATIQEGAEIILYVDGFSAAPDLFRPVLFGSLIGIGIGLSFGVFIYYLLVNVSRTNGLRIGFVMILLIAGGMVLQSIQLLTQVDWVSSQYPLWNSSALISEQSLTGQMLYALIGYEATPTPTQVVSYFVSLALILVLSAYLYFYRRGLQNA